MARAEAARLAEEQRKAEEVARAKAAAEEAARLAALAKQIATETLRSAMDAARDAARERAERAQARERATESGTDVRETRQSADSVTSGGMSGDLLAALQSAVVKAEEEQVSWAWMAITWVELI